MAPQNEESKKQEEHAQQAKPAHPRKNPLEAIRQHPLYLEVAVLLVVSFIIISLFYWQDFNSKVYIEDAKISAPIISLGPEISGTLDQVYVDEGDTVSKGQKLAQVGGTAMTAKTSGVIVSVLDAPGQFVSPATSVVKMIDTSDLRLVGEIQEDKGLRYIEPGQKVVFTVDAFPEKQYYGTVEKVALTSSESDIVFSVSDKRQESDFEVTALFDTASYAELKNGMSAKMWVYK